MCNCYLAYNIINDKAKIYYNIEKNTFTQQEAGVACPP